MSGQAKKRIDFAGWSVDIFSNDTKIDKLLDACGWKGFGVYFYLCMMAYGGEGYYYEWCYELCASTARKMGGGMSAKTVREAVNCCLQIGLFDKGAFDRWQILTSRGIQTRYLVVLKSNKRAGTKIYNEYWLLDKNDRDYRGVIFVPKNGENDDSHGGNSHSHGGNEYSRRQKESKVNNSICMVSADVNFEKFWNSYPKQMSRFLAEQAYVQLVTSGIDESDLITAAVNYAETCRIKKTPENFISEPANWLNQSKWVDYTDESYKRPEPKKALKSGDKFNNFDQRTYDYDALEKQLLQKGSK